MLTALFIFQNLDTPLHKEDIFQPWLPRFHLYRNYSKYFIPSTTEYIEFFLKLRHSLLSHWYRICILFIAMNSCPKAVNMNDDKKRKRRIATCVEASDQIEL